MSESIQEATRPEGKSPGTIDQAIEVTLDFISRRKKEANKWLMISMALLMSFIATFLFIQYANNYQVDALYDNIQDYKLASVRFNESTQQYGEAINQLYNHEITFRLDTFMTQERFDELYDQVDQSYRKLVNAGYYSDTLFTKLANTDIDDFRSNMESKTISGAISYILYAFFVFLIALSISFYRYNIREVTRNEHNLLGFSRIRIAGNNSPNKFEDVVRYYLVKDAFDSASKKSKEVESPVPGHPGSDAGAMALNMIMEEYKKLTSKNKKEE